jgi:hypothetical protein
MRLGSPTQGGQPGGWLALGTPSSSRPRRSPPLPWQSLGAPGWCAPMTRSWKRPGRAIAEAGGGGPQARRGDRCVGPGPGPQRLDRATDPERSGSPRRQGNRPGRRPSRLGPGASSRLAGIPCSRLWLAGQAGSGRGGTLPRRVRRVDALGPHRCGPGLPPVAVLEVLVARLAQRKTPLSRHFDMEDFKCKTHR